MAQCVAIVGGAVVEDATSPCPGFMLVTVPEYEAISTNPFRLDPVDGLAVSAAVIGVWGAAFAFRALVNALRDRADGD